MKVKEIIVRVIATIALIGCLVVLSLRFAGYR